MRMIRLLCKFLLFTVACSLSLPSKSSVLSKSLQTVLKFGALAIFFPLNLPDVTFAALSSPVIYRSGKAPEGLPVAKTDSKKDYGFLRCMSNCKAQCLKPSEGLAKLDCAQDCQDQCCNSYEQCSFKITTNIGGGL